MAMDRRRYYTLVAIAIVIGVAIGLFAVGFRMLWLAGLDLLWSRLGVGPERVAVSVVAGLVVGAIAHLTFYPGSLSTVVERFHADGRIPSRDSVPVVPSNLVGLIAGQSAGPEGMMSVVGGSAGTVVAERFDLPRARKLLTLAGMGAGFGTILGAPIGGGLLWLELPHERGMEYYEAIVPTLAASFAGYLTFAAVGGIGLYPTWDAPALFPLRQSYLLVAVGVGVAVIPFSYLYVKLFDVVGEAFRRSGARPIVRTTAAGVGIGLLGWALPLTYFYGGKQINVVLSGSFPPWLLAVTLGGEMLAAALTINGNWHGGLIIPHMLMGALVGRLVAFLPGVGPVMGMLTGMASFNSTVTGTPLSSALIAIALTNGASIIPVFLASLVAFLASPRVPFIESTAARTEMSPLDVRD